MSSSEQNLSFLEIVDICDNTRPYQPSPDPWTSFDIEQLTPLYLSLSPSSPAIGLLRPQVLEQLKLENQRSRTLNQPELWLLHLDEKSWIQRDGRPLRPSVSLADWLDNYEKRNVAFKELCERWRDEETFVDVCGPKKWRNELYPIYADPFGVHDHPIQGQVKNYIFEVERSACALFGLVTYGVHMSAYEEVTSSDGRKSLKIWVPTRAKTKPTFPGKLDNTVAGGIPSGMSMFESMVKECDEEASIPERVARKYIRATGSVSYFYRTSKGWLQPEVEYTYDLQIPPGGDSAIFTPRPSDGEVECFELLDQEEVIRRMRLGLFKPNCALVLIDLFIRLGYITPDNEPNFQKIITRLHGSFDFERW